jgi:hypothetical protein
LAVALMGARTRRGMGASSALLIDEVLQNRDKCVSVPCRPDTYIVSKFMKFKFHPNSRPVTYNVSKFMKFKLHPNSIQTIMQNLNF